MSLSHSEIIIKKKKSVEFSEQHKLRRETSGLLLKGFSFSGAFVSLCTESEGLEITDFVTEIVHKVGELEISEQFFCALK